MHRLAYLATAWSLLVLAPSAAVAQEPVPVVRARSKIADIVDGNHVKKAYWLVMPERKPDLYFVEVPRRPHRVTFRTDVDSISFDTHYGDVFDFVVVLSNGDSARTQVRAQYRQVRRSVDVERHRVAGHPIWSLASLDVFERWVGTPLE